LHSEFFDIDVDKVITTIRDNNATLVMLPSPNNPTGNVLSQDDIGNFQIHHNASALLRLLNLQFEMKCETG
tara:strand:+ start:375 stop:587 length:213 start_codon:yes stop_codon:yes gene_type:complete